MDIEGYFDEWEFKDLQINGVHMLYDVKSAQLYRADELIIRIAHQIGRRSFDEIISDFRHQYTVERIKESYESLTMLAKKAQPVKLSVPEETIADDISQITISPIDNCNLRCRYCWNNYGRYDYGPIKMNKKIAQRTVDFIFEHINKTKKFRSPPTENNSIRVEFFGGEPLLAFDLVQYFVEEFGKRGNGLIFNYFLETNGVLLKDEIIKYFKDKNIFVAISLDGPQEIHDRARIFPNGKGSWEVVFPNVLKAKNAGILNGVRATLYPDSSLDIIKVYRFLKNHNLPNIQVEFATERHISESGCSRKLYNEERGDREKIKETYKRFAEYYLECVLNNNHRERPKVFDRRITSLFNDRPRLYPCGMPNMGGLFITATGDIYPCLGFVGLDAFRLGNVASGLVSNARLKFNKYRVDQRPGCKDCWLRFSCGGMCFADSALHHGNIWQPESRICDWIKFKIEILMWLITEIKSKNLEFFKFLTLGFRIKEVKSKKQSDGGYRTNIKIIHQEGMPYLPLALSLTTKKDIIVKKFKPKKSEVNLTMTSELKPEMAVLDFDGDIYDIRKRKNPQYIS